MKPSLHRSVTFWSGILVMAFICWAWRDSAHRWCGQFLSDWVVCTRDSAITITHRPGDNMGWAHIAAPASEFGVESNVPRLAIPEISLPRKLTAAEMSEVHSRGTLMGRRLDPLLEEYYLSPHRIAGEQLIVIPYWLSLLLFAVPWFALLLWRAQRRRPGAAVP